MGFGAEKYVRRRSGILYTLNKLAEEGHCYATREQLIEKAVELLSVEDNVLSMTLDDMIKQKDLLPLTGYVHGGCSPIGMKKQFPTFIHETATGYEKIFVSAGKVGFQIELAPQDLAEAASASFADLI